MGMAQLIEGNLKVNTNCGADIKVKGEKKDGVIWCKEKWRSVETQQKDVSVSIGKKNSSQDIFLSAIYSENLP